MGLLENVSLGLPTPVALAAVAVLDYLAGQWRRLRSEGDSGAARRELRRAKTVIRQLESVANEVRLSLATHHTSILRFKERIADLSGQQETAAWQELSDEAEKILRPTLRLATQIAHAYDEIRQQTNLLMTFTEVRTDPLTGLSNRRGLDDSLDSMFAMHRRYGVAFSVAIFDIDHFKRINDEQGHLAGDDVLKRVANLLDGCVRETDIVTRFGGEEFVVVMPGTELAGASLFADRMRRRVADKVQVTVSGGVAAAADGDNAKALLARADAALYSAKSAGRNVIFQHDGERISLVEATDEELGDEPSPGESNAEAADDLALSATE